MAFKIGWQCPDHTGLTNCIRSVIKHVEGSYIVQSTITIIKKNPVTCIDFLVTGTDSDTLSRTSSLQSLNDITSKKKKKKKKKQCKFVFDL